MGIDIGTTTVSMVLLNCKSGSFLGKETIEHQAFLPGETPEEKLQNPDKIWSLTRERAEEMIERYGAPDVIGLTGQMHGMLYVDRYGNAVSPLYTWQDGNGKKPLEEGKSSAEILKEKVGQAAAGYGLSTHFYLQKTGKIPKNAVKMTTISDYIAMKFCGGTTPVVGPDMAASWGCFDLEKKEFLYDALRQAGVDISFLPEVKKEHFLVGKTEKGIPAAGSIGDNQASFLGSVDSLQDTVLINVGTGSQVSFVSEGYIACQGDMELRPCMGNRYLLVGSALCGGRAYALLEKFYREVSGKTDESCYDMMYEQAQEFLHRYGTKKAWKVRTTFSGTRDKPDETGRITGIDTENFHPGALTVGVLLGILEELHQQYLTMCARTGKKAARLVGSGNGIRKNPLLRELAEEVFGMKLELPKYREEAAVGAALRAGGLLEKTKNNR